MCDDDETHTAPMSWPHAPPHKLALAGTFFVTGATYRKEHHFRAPVRLQLVQDELFKIMLEHEWRLEAWAIFSNHYQFVAQTPQGDRSAQVLSSMIRLLHSRTARFINGVDNTPTRKVWHNYFETRLTIEGAYLTRLNYVHQNPVKHGLVATGSDYPWCSARWFESVCTPARLQTIYRLRTDCVNVEDKFEPSPDWKR